MKKIFTLTFIAVSMSLMSFGQYYFIPSELAGINPGDLNQEDTEFPVGSGASAGWTVVLGPNQSAATWSPAQTIPFSFDLNGNNYTQYMVSSTGILTFDLTSTFAPSSSNGSLPDASIPDNSLCIWGIEGTGTNDNAVSKTFGVAPNRQHWISFTSYSATGTGWTYWSIVLEETTGNIHFVDQRTDGAVSLTIGYQENATTAYEFAGSPNIGSFSTNAADRSDNSFYTLAKGTQPQYDFAGISVILGKFVKTNSPNDIVGEVRNMGSETITTLDVNYTVDNGTAVTASVTGLNIAPYDKYQFTHPTAWNPTISGDHTIDIYVNNLNGNMDVNSSNDKASQTVAAVEDFTDRRPFHESFTSSTCGPCVAGNANVKTVMDATTEEEIILKYQMSWPGNGDPYFTDEAGDRRTYYGINAVPYMMVDGGWFGNSTTYTSAVYDEFKSVSALIEITGEYSINEDDQTVGIDAVVTPLSSISDNLTLYVAILERTTYDNTGSNGETEFDYVMKKMVPGSAGHPIGSLTANTDVNYSVTYAFNGPQTLPANATDPVDHAIEHSIEEFDDLMVVAWVQDDNDQFIHQSNYLVLVESANGVDGTVDPNNPTGPGLAVKTEVETKGFSLFPNPATDVLNIAIEGSNGIVTIFDAVGNLVFSESMNSNQTQINTSEFAKGLYLVQIENDGSVISEKLTIK